MIKEIIATGKDIIEAKENARLALGAGELDDVKFEVLHAGSKGIFGLIGVKPAQVKAYIELPDAPQRRPKHDKPKHENKESAKPAAEKNSDGEQNAETVKKSNNHKKKNNRHKPKTDESRASQESKPKSQVIPENELKFELRQVSEGEDMSFDFIKTVIADIGLNAEAELYSCDDGTRRITIKGEDASTLIGHHGDTLDALQYLANLASTRKNINGERDKSRVTLDIEGYRAKREDTLRALALRMANKAIKNKRSVMLEPMSAYERRIIHSAIQDIEGVSTNSIGSDNNRRIIIFLTEKKPKGVFESDNQDEMVADETNDVVQSVDQIVSSDEETNDADTVTIVNTHPDSECECENDEEDMK